RLPCGRWLACQLARHTHYRFHRPGVHRICMEEPQKDASQRLGRNNSMKQLLNPRLLALVQKEFNQLRRDPKVVISLIVPPILQLLLFGFILNSKIENVRLGVIDQSNTPESRELIAELSQSRSFRLTRSYLTPADLTNAITDRTLQAGLVIPYDFGRDL